MRRLWSRARGLMAWARRVVADVGQHDPVPVYLERSEDGHGYVFRLGVRAGFGGHHTARIAVHHRVNPAPHPILKEVHYCEVAGRTLEAANVHALREKVAAMLDATAPARVLPLCYFRVPAADYEIAVYEDGGTITAPVLGGPKLRASDLAGIRRDVCRYLTSAGYVGDLDEVEVGVLRPSDLRRVPPAAVFCSHADSGLWIPSVEGMSPDGPVVGVLGQSPELRTAERRRSGAGPPVRESAPAAPDVVALLRVLRAELRQARAVSDPDAVYASRVRPEIWAAAEERSEDARAILVAYLSDGEATRLELTVRRTSAGDVVTALDDRGINVLVAADEDALASAVGRYLAGQGFLRFREEVEIHAAAVPRAEWLDADTIFQRGEGSIAAPAPSFDEPQEVQQAWN